MVIFACFVPCFKRQSVEFCFVSPVSGLQARLRRSRRSEQRPPLLDIATQVRNTVVVPTQDIRCLLSPLVWPHRLAFDKASSLMCRCNCEKAGRGNLKPSQLVMSQATVMLHVQNKVQQHRLMRPSECSLRELQANAACAA